MEQCYEQRYDSIKYDKKLIVEREDKDCRNLQIRFISTGKRENWMSKVDCIEDIKIEITTCLFVSSTIARFDVQKTDMLCLLNRAWLPFLFWVLSVACSNRRWPAACRCSCLPTSKSSRESDWYKDRYRSEVNKSRECSKVGIAYVDDLHISVLRFLLFWRDKRR